MRNDRLLRTTVCGVTAALLLLGGRTHAAAVGEDAVAIFKRADVNENGRLDGIELRDRKWLAYDRDGDGEVTRAEFMASAASKPAAQKGGATRRPTTAQEWNRWGHAYLKQKQDAHAMWAFAMGMRPIRATARTSKR